MKRIPELDGLRGIAAVGVVFFHWFSTYTFWMWSFVDLFFVLSGFLISRIIFTGLSTGQFSLRNFWMRRILRIWPIYYITLAGLCLIAFIRSGSSFFDSSYATDALMASVYLQYTQHYFLWDGDRLAIFYFLPGFLHSWSLAVEEQFYVFWPLAAVFLLPRLGYRPIIWLCLLCLLVGAFTRDAGLQPALLLSRIDGLAVGVLLAALYCMNRDKEPFADSRFNWFFAGSGLLGITFCASYMIQGYTTGVGLLEVYEDPTLVTGFALVYFAVVGMAIKHSGSPIIAFLKTPLMLYLGAISYAMYMFHYPILAFVEPRFEHILGEGLRPLSVLLTGICLVAVPHFSGLLIEQPLLKYKIRYPVTGKGRPE